jgi:hypothetical protein
MARPAAELGRFHVLYSPIGNLSSDQNVEQSGDTKEQCNATYCRLAVEGGLSQSFANPHLAEINPDWNQNQSGEENQWKDKKDDDANVRVINVGREPVAATRKAKK